MNERKRAKKPPEYLNDAVIYQIFLRAFTPAGTLKSAEKMLPHIKSIGADIVYLCPICEADADENRTYWSIRQRECGLENPKNPYRISDYFHVDSEYGTDDDLRDFIKTAHSLGLRVILDLVYYHCGPKAVFLDENPDFVQRDENGDFIIGGWWLFPRLNYNSQELREYLFSNMEYYVREFDCDGFRCDVGDLIPLDFWEEGRRRIEKIKPDVMMLNEGKRKEDQEKAFDVNYYFADNEEPGRGSLARLLSANKDAAYFKKVYKEYMDEFITDGGLVLLGYDNHDYANDTGKNRYEKTLGSEAIEMILFYMYTMRGVPFLYNGCEVADENEHSIWANRFHGANMTVEWENALTEKGKRRLEKIREFNSLRKSISALSCRANVYFPPCENDNVLVFAREYEEQKYLVCLNLSGESQCTSVGVIKSVVHSYGVVCGNGILEILPYGYALFEL